MKNSIKPQGCTNLKLRQLTRIVTRHYDDYVAQTGLKNTQYALLTYVVRFGPIQPVDLAKLMRMDASTLTRNLQLLAAQGLLKIVAGKDARSRLIKVTEDGLTKQVEGQHAWKLAQIGLNQRLGVERVALLHDLLDTCLEYLDSHPNES